MGGRKLLVLMGVGSNLSIPFLYVETIENVRDERVVNIFMIEGLSLNLHSYLNPFFKKKTPLDELNDTIFYLLCSRWLLLMFKPSKDHAFLNTVSTRGGDGFQPPPPLILLKIGRQNTVYTQGLKILIILKCQKLNLHF